MPEFKSLLILSILVCRAGLGGESCAKKLAGYEKGNRAYMEQVHVPDAELAQTTWEDTLYRPMHAFFNEYCGQAKHIVYVGGGSQAPYFLNEVTGFKGDRLTTITLIDIDAEALEIAKSRIERRYPRIQVRTLNLDVTQGVAESFYQKLNGKTHSKYKIKKESVDAGSNGSLLILDADVLISEMVATYTGIPALFAFESRTGESAIPSLLSAMQYRQYNENAVRKQMSVYRQMIRSGGKILVATDTMKIYDENTQPVEYSLPSSFTWESVGLRRQGETNWIDAELNSALRQWGTPHSHRVELLMSD